VSFGFVGNFIRFSVVQNFENRLIFDKVTDSLKVGTFSETQCRLPAALLPSLPSLKVSYSV